MVFIVYFCKNNSISTHMEYVHRSTLSNDKTYDLQTHFPR